MKRTQAELFDNMGRMNGWLQNFDGKVLDIKMAGEMPYMKFLVIYEKEFNEYR